MAIDEDNDDGEGGRTRARLARRDAARLGLELVALPPGKVAALGLPDVVVRAIDEGRRTPSHTARKRQIGFIEGLLRALDDDALTGLNQALQAPEGVADAHAEWVEAWSRRLRREGALAVEDLLHEKPDADRQQLRQLARNAARESAPGRAARALEACLVLLSAR